MVCQSRWTEAYQVMVPAMRGIAAADSPDRIESEAILLAHRIPKLVTKKYRATYVHSSVTFLQYARLGSQTSDGYAARLQIPLEPPPNVTQGTARWSIVAAIDVARGRDAKAWKTLQLILG